MLRGNGTEDPPLRNRRPLMPTQEQATPSNVFGYYNCEAEQRPTSPHRCRALALRPTTRAPTLAVPTLCTRHRSTTLSTHGL
jgi:hypothetical protein